VVLKNKKKKTLHPVNRKTNLIIAIIAIFCPRRGKKE
jgi:hypothetical protein